VDGRASDWFALLLGLLVIGALFDGFVTNWSFGDGQEFLVLNCSGDWGDAHKCDGPAAVDGPIRVRVNPTSRSVAIWSGTPTVTQAITGNCTVVDDFNWTCTDRTAEAQQLANSIGADFGEDGGRFYMSVTGGPPPDYYHSSLRGWPYLLYRLRFVNLRKALDLDGITGPVTDLPRGH
jgi:hypothetical protein